MASRAQNSGGEGSWTSWARGPGGTPLQEGGGFGVSTVSYGTSTGSEKNVFGYRAHPVGATDPHAVGGRRATWVGLCPPNIGGRPSFRV